MAYGTINADQIGTSVANTSLGAGNASIMKNRIINGAMMISQYNGTSSVTATTVNEYSVDRWQCVSSVSSKYTAQQNAGSVTPPVGFANYLGLTSSSAYSSGASDYLFIRQNIEGFNTADLQWGTANAKTVTVSFWVRSSLTGTFGGALRNATTDYSYPFTYTISSANTWEQKSVTIAGPTSGTWVGATNGIGLTLIINLGTGTTFSGTAGAWAASNYVNATGSVSVTGTSGATLYLTGVQLEVGSSATGYEYRQYGQELALCQRYAYKFGSNVPYNGGFYTTTQILATIIFPVTMRATPTYTAGTATAFYGGGSTSVTPSANQQSANSGLLTLTGATSVAGIAVAIITNNDLFSAEL